MGTDLGMSTLTICSEVLVMGLLGKGCNNCKFSRPAPGRTALTDLATATLESLRQRGRGLPKLCRLLRSGGG